MAATYAQLRNGDWGVRATMPVEAGDAVTVTKKSGETSRETIQKVLWHGDGVWLCSIKPKARSSSGYRGRSSQVCDACGHDGDGCADMDCACRVCGGMMR